MSARRTTRARRAGRSTLWLIAGLLATSGAIRLGIETGPALAKEVAALSADGFDTATGGAGTEMAGCAHTEDVARVLEALGAREATLEARETALADRLSALKLAEEEVGRNLAALESAEAELRQTMTAAETAAEGDIERLTSVYENMKPKQAAPLFEEMAPDFAAGFLGRMRPDAAAAIMSGLSAPAAYSISVILAGRNANVPRE